jgi:hypothetical protein
MSLFFKGRIWHGRSALGIYIITPASYKANTCEKRAYFGYRAISFRSLGARFISDEGSRFELKEAPYCAQLESPKRGSSTYFQIAKGVVPALEQEVYTAISPFEK